MEGSMSRAEPSTLKPEIVDGSILQDRTLHENALHHGRFSIQSGTIRAEARNRGRFHSPDQFPRPIPQTHSADPSPRPEPLRCLIQSRQFNIPVGMELTTSSARQDTAPLSRILLRSARYFPTKSRRLLQHSSPPLLLGRWTIRHCPGHYLALPRA